MTIERNRIVRELNINGFQFHEKRRTLDNRRVAMEAGSFLKASGISDAIIDFRQGFLGEMGDLRNEIHIEDTGYASSANIVLEWIDPDDLKHLILKISAGRSYHKEKYISASFKQEHHYKVKKHDSRILEISLLPLSKEFNFTDPVSRKGKIRYKRWLREKILNYELVWGD